MSIRVGVNLAWLVPAVVGGSEEATVSALAAVADLAPDGIEPVVFGLPSLAVAHPRLVDRFEFHELAASGRRKGVRVLVENTALARAAGRAGLTFVHHAGGVVPPGVRLPATLAIHDTQPLDLPDNFGWVKRRYLGVMIGASARRATGITVPSTFVKERVIARTGVDPDRVTVVPWSVPAWTEPEPAEVDRIRSVFRLTRPYAIYPAIAYAHKNHATLLDAVGRLGRGDLDLVLTGGPGPLDAEVAARSARADLAGRVHVLGRVPRDRLAALIAGAAVVAVPSRYEGFGLPALEAMAAGRPLVVSDAGSLPEVVGGGALVVAPDDVDGWADALAAVLGDDDVRRRLVAAAAEATASWTPRRTATGLIDVWTRAAQLISDPRTAP